MPCTTLLVGKGASYDGSTMIARNDDSGAAHFVPKRLAVMQPEDQPRVYRSVLSKIEIPLPENPMRYTYVPNAFLEVEGVWAAAGFNACNVAMTATETITSNPLVQAADPLVGEETTGANKSVKGGGIGEEDFLMITLPYIKSAREGVLRVGKLLEEYGTYEMNGMAFQDVDEVWWLETIGGHHWMARRVPDDCYVVAPNQLTLDEFDLDDALGEGKDHLCSADLREFIEKNHLNLCMDGSFNAKLAFGSHSDSDHCYNTPRAWFGQRYLNPRSNVWDGPDADYTPESDDIPWARVPERKITIEDAKYVLSGHFQGTPYDPYASYGSDKERGAYRPIGINRNDFCALMQIRPYKEEALRAVEWLCFGSNTYNAIVPFYPMVDTVPSYWATTNREISTDSFYWANRLIAALADAQYAANLSHVERYQRKMLIEGYKMLLTYDAKMEDAIGGGDASRVQTLAQEANEQMAKVLKTETQNLLDKVLYETSIRMKNSYTRNDS